MTNMDNKQKMTAPVAVDKSYNIKITGLGNGEGIGKVDNFTVFVPFALPGEDVTVRIIEVKKNYAKAVLVSVNTPSEERIEPVCPVFKACGGCQLQHMTYKAELCAKEKQVADALLRIGHLDGVTTLPIIESEQPLAYRNQMRLAVSGSAASGNLKIGYFEASTHKIIDIESCAIQRSENNTVLHVIRQWMVEYDVAEGLIRNIISKVGVSTGDVLVCLIVSCGDVPYVHELIDMLKEEIPKLKSLVINITKLNSLFGSEMQLRYGKGLIKDKIGENTYNIGVRSFLQVNSGQTQKLYDLALEFAELSGNEIVADVYCGVGTITMAFAKHAKRALGIEISKSAVADANRNAEDNNVRNVEFVLGDAAEKLPKMVKDGVRPDVVILDPPRIGCDKKVLKAITTAKPKKIVYISCNPATLARDLAILDADGFEVVKVRPVDMFSRTQHVETVVLMSRVQK